MDANSHKPIELQLNARNHARLFAGIPDAVKQLVKGQKDIVLAGGAIRSALEAKPANDYDIFFLSDDASTGGLDFDNNLTGVAARLNETASYLMKRGFKLVFACPEYKLMTLKAGNVKIQLINRRTYKTIKNILESFDFSICQFATADFSTLWTTLNAVRDVKLKRLTLVDIAYPAASLNRLHKYRNYGYKANERLMSDICLCIYNLYSLWGDDYDTINDHMVFYID